jgi:hypothetical protein
MCELISIVSVFTGLSPLYQCECSARDISDWRTLQNYLSTYTKDQ